MSRPAIHSSGWISDDLGVYSRLILVTNGGSFEAGVYPCKDKTGHNTGCYTWDSVLRLQGKAPQVHREIAPVEFTKAIWECQQYGRSKLRG